MYQRFIPARILTSVGIGLLIFSLVFGWVAFAVPDWLQFYERGDGLKSNDTLADENFKDFKKFGLWYKCIFSISANDFVCTLWNRDTPSFVRVAQVLVSLGLILACLSLLLACFGFICRRAFITTLLFSALLAFLSFIFITIGVTVFANESLVYVDRLRLPNNDTPRRWGMWLLIPNIVLTFITSICFILASILNWCDHRSMEITGIFSHSGDKYNGSVGKAPSDSNTTTPLKQPFQYQDYPNACYQINGLNNAQQNPMGYPMPPGYVGGMNRGFQPTPSGLFGYSRPSSPTMYPHSNLDPYHSRHYMTENSEMDDFSHSGRSRRRSRSHSRSHRHSNHRSRSLSPRDSTVADDNTPRQTQFVPIPVPYYQPHPPPPPAPQPQTTHTQMGTSNNSSQPMSYLMPQMTQTPMTTSNNISQPISYIMPQGKQQYMEDNLQPAMKGTNVLKYGLGQQAVLVPNSNQPVYTIAYRTNNTGNVGGSNILSGPAATTYVTAARNPVGDSTSFNSDSDNEKNDYQVIPKRKNLKKIDINETWAWRKMR